MSNASKLLNKFRVSDENMNAGDTLTTDAYGKYISKRHKFGEAHRELNEAIKTLHDLLDEPLRASGLIPEGKDWTLTEDEDDGLFIQVWSEPKHRGRKKPEVPMHQLSFKPKTSKAA